MSFDVSVGIVRTPDEIHVFEHSSGNSVLMATFEKDDALGALAFVERTQQENGSSYEGVSLSGFASAQSSNLPSGLYR